MAPVTAIKQNHNTASETAEKLTKAFEAEARLAKPAKKKAAPAKKAVVQVKPKLKPNAKATVKAATKEAVQTDALSSFKKVSEVLSQVNKELVEISAQNFERNMQAAKDSFQVKNIGQLSAIQTKLLQENIKNGSKQISKLNELFLSSFKNS